MEYTIYEILIELLVKLTAILMDDLQKSKEQLIQEIEQSPDYLMEEVLNFLLCINMRLHQKQESLKNSDNSILNMVDEITAQIPPQELNHSTYK